MLKNVNVSILCQVADKLGQCKNTIIFPKTIHFSKIQKSVSSFCICMYIRSPFLKFFEIWHPFAKNENFPILCQAAHKFMFTWFCLFLKCIWSLTMMITDFLPMISNNYITCCVMQIAIFLLLLYMSALPSFSAFPLFFKRI